MMKKTRFESHHQFISMEEIIVEEIRGMNGREIVALAVVCLHAFIKCLPN
jgi:hypothetical protein